MLTTVIAAFTIRSCLILFSKRKRKRVDILLQYRSKVNFLLKGDKDSNFKGSREIVANHG